MVEWIAWQAFKLVVACIGMVMFVSLLALIQVGVEHWLEARRRRGVRAAVTHWRRAAKRGALSRASRWKKLEDWAHRKATAETRPEE